MRFVFPIEFAFMHAAGSVATTSSCNACICRLRLCQTVVCVVMMQKRGRQLTYEKTHPKFADGTKWTGRTTRAHEFGFTTSIDPGELKALRKPVTPATVTFATHTRVAPPPEYFAPYVPPQQQQQQQYQYQYQYQPPQ